MATGKSEKSPLLAKADEKGTVSLLVDSMRQNQEAKRKACQNCAAEFKNLGLPPHIEAWRTWDTPKEKGVDFEVHFMSKADKMRAEELLAAAGYEFAAVFEQVRKTPSVKEIMLYDTIEKEAEKHAAALQHFTVSLWHKSSAVNENLAPPTVKITFLKPPEQTFVARDTLRIRLLPSSPLFPFMNPPTGMKGPDRPSLS